MKMKTKEWMSAVAICLAAILLALMLASIPSQKSGPEKGYSMTVAHSADPGDASYSVTLYGPDGEPVLRLDAYHVAGTFEEPGYSYGFTWLDDVELKISEVWGQ